MHSPLVQVLLLSAGGFIFDYILKDRFQSAYAAYTLGFQRSKSRLELRARHLLLFLIAAVFSYHTQHHRADGGVDAVLTVLIAGYAFLLVRNAIGGMRQTSK